MGHTDYSGNLGQAEWTGIVATTIERNALRNGIESGVLRAHVLPIFLTHTSSPEPALCNPLSKTALPIPTLC